MKDKTNNTSNKSPSDSHRFWPVTAKETKDKPMHNHFKTSI